MTLVQNSNNPISASVHCVSNTPAYFPVCHTEYLKKTRALKSQGLPKLIFFPVLRRTFLGECDDSDAFWCTRNLASSSRCV